MKKIYKITKETQHNINIKFIELNKHDYELVSSLVNSFNMEESKTSIDEVKQYFRVSICRHSDCEFCPEQLIKGREYISINDVVETKFNNISILSYNDGTFEYALFISGIKAIAFRDKYLRKNLNK
jgi:hypothetical protein